MPHIWQQDQRAVGDTFCPSTSGLGEFRSQWMKTMRSNSVVLEPEAHPHHHVPARLTRCFQVAARVLGVTPPGGGILAASPSVLPAPSVPGPRPTRPPGEGSSSPQGRGSGFSGPPAAFPVLLRWGGPTPLEGTPVLVEGQPSSPAPLLPVRGRRALCSPCRRAVLCRHHGPGLVGTRSLTSSGSPHGYRRRPRAACPQTLDVRTRPSGEAGNAQVPPWIALLSALSAGHENPPPADPFTAPRAVPQLPRASLSLRISPRQVNLTSTAVDLPVL
ncbi:unnamed protein product [Rangifer tarandus platyrhynchus]|uniref:Uncharacterized protein n=1 Tax=Rangifer tarandus platyrhynchus TaxID=3082113 RepID=A0ABN8ZCK9_RANTA|nr:unnamed protein product [Rangifer tarandus platyrhynchus]